MTLALNLYIMGRCPQAYPPVELFLGEMPPTFCPPPDNTTAFK